MPIDGKYGRIIVQNQRNLGDNEPVIVFRAEDRLALTILWIYRRLCELAGSPQNHLDSLDEVARVFKEWQAEHGTHTPTSKGHNA